jgi:hypothetical protein
MRSGADAELRARNLRTLAVLAALFVLPLVIAFCVYYGTVWRPAGRVNHGVLISPPRPLPQLSLSGPASADGLSPRTPWHGKWWLVYVGDGACDAACRRALTVMRQARLALNTDRTRVERLLLATGECCAREFFASQHPGLRVVDATGSAAAPLLEAFPAADREHTVFVVDPLGNLMMSYDARRDPRGLLEDLKKLLRLSQIG